jgi:protein TonB
MQRLLRTSMSLPLAGLITFSLAVLMTYLISVEGEPQPVADELVVELFPHVEPIDPPGRLTIEPVDAVEPPPPPPPIEVVRSGRPVEDGFPGAELPPIAGPEIEQGDFNPRTVDAAAMAEVRIPPDYPVRALERGLEGYCQVGFDIGPDGRPINVRAHYCSHGIFERNSIRAVTQWRYSPSVVDGRAVVHRGMQTRIDFAFND